MSWKRASRSRRQLDQIMDTKAVVCHQDWLGKGALVPCSSCWRISCWRGRTRGVATRQPKLFVHFGSPTVTPTRRVLTGEKLLRPAPSFQVHLRSFQGGKIAPNNVREGADGFTFSPSKALGRHSQTDSVGVRVKGRVSSDGLGSNSPTSFLGLTISI
jgi:hypothetical protein